jgi:replicative DNA helicase
MTETLRDPTQYWSIEAEAAVIGSMIIDDQCIPEVLGIITRTDMFFDDRHKIIFDAIISLFIKNKPIEAVMLRTELKRIKKLDDVGGPEFISKILDNVPSSANALYYAKIVREKFNYRNMLQVIQQIKEVPDGIGDSSELIERIQTLALNMQVEKDVEVHTFKNEAAESVVTLAEQKHLIKTGFKDLDRIISGFYNFEYVIIAGRPGMGKTTLGCDIALRMAKAGKRVIIFSMEMSAESLIQRAICSVAGINADSWKGNPPQHEFDNALKTAEELSDYGIFIYENIENARKMYAILSAAQRVKSVDMVLVDNIQLMQTNPPIQKEYERLTIISRQLKKITQALHIPVVCVSHLNREVDKRDEHRPRMSDLKGSGSMEQDADIILFLHREDQYRKQKKADIDPSEFDGIAEVIVAKNRRGRCGIAKLVFRDEFTTFNDIAPEYTTSQMDFPK